MTPQEANLKLEEAHKLIFEHIYDQSDKILSLEIERDQLKERLNSVLESLEVELCKEIDATRKKLLPLRDIKVWYKRKT